MEMLQFQSSMCLDEKRGPCRLLEYSTKCFPKILFSDITFTRQHVKFSDPGTSHHKAFFSTLANPQFGSWKPIYKLYYIKQEFPGDIILMKGTKPCVWGRNSERKSSWLRETRFLEVSSITSVYSFCWAGSKHSHFSWEKYKATSLNVNHLQNKKHLPNGHR